MRTNCRLHSVTIPLVLAFPSLLVTTYTLYRYRYRYRSLLRGSSLENGPGRSRSRSRNRKAKLAQRLLLIAQKASIR
ncbi:hypothetical protein GGR50DRAFT_652373 [Xylaria sp. CBS 124048]|nr:hypothetical protein GGR50DRAFT_652373 [Xylaria sp. CBS 124048]